MPNQRTVRVAMTTAEANAAVAAPGDSVGRSTRAMYVYVIAQFACQVALLVPGLGEMRPLFRTMAFGTSLAILAFVSGAPLVRHPVRLALGAAVLVLALSALNPDSGGFAALASFCFQLSILAPVFWIARMRCTDRDLEKLLILIWAFSTASATVGVLQAWFPGRFQPTISSYSSRNLSALMIPTASGIWIPRPTGLTDTPGGAGAGGYYAVLLGLAVGLLKPFRYARAAAAASAAMGMTCMYLCQIRTLVVMLLVALCGMLALSAAAGRIPRVALTAFAGGLFFLLGIPLALALGGDTTLDRYQALLISNPTQAYQVSRGDYLSYAFDVMLPKYPLGAGLGRWGQMANYFGNPADEQLSAEIQWLAWVIDGGLPLVLTYPVAILMVAWNAVSVALKRTTARLEVWSMVIAGYNLGGMALTFSYPIFMSTIGLEFWLVNAALIQAHSLHRAHEASPQRLTALTPSRSGP